MQKIIWLQGIPDRDITDCHIDTLARFGLDNTIILSRPHATAPQSDPFYGVYEQAKAILSNATDSMGKPFSIVEIEEAKTVPRAAEDESIPDEACTSYVNFYLVNGGIIVPQFGDKRTDSRAIEAIKGLWPEREVVPVTLNWLAWAGGGVHCATQQWPSIPK